MSFPVTIALTASEHASTVPVVDPGSASGIFSLTWLVIALPLAGAAILLLGGRRTDRWGHLLGTALPIGSFVLSVLMFVELLGRDEAERQVGQHLYTWFQVGTLDVGFDLLYDPLSALFLLLITGVGSLIHVYSIGYMAHDPRRRRFFGYLNLFVAAMLMLVLAENYLVPVPGLGGRRPGVVPADRLLAAQAVRGGRGREGVRDQPGRRHRHVAGDHADVRHVRDHGLRRRSARRPRAPTTPPSTRSACCSCSAPAASPPRCRCSPGCSTRWRARPRCRR